MYDNSKRAIISSDMCRRILYFYLELYQNYEVMTPPQIAEELCISKETLRKFYALYLNNDENLTDAYVIIMLSTQFGNTSIHFEEQKKTFGELMEQRKRIHEAKVRHDKIYQMVKKRSAEYMAKRNNHLK